MTPQDAVYAACGNIEVAVELLGGDLLRARLACLEALVDIALDVAGGLVKDAVASGVTWRDVADATGFVSPDKARKRYTGRLVRPASGERALVLEKEIRSLSWPASSGLTKVRDLEVLALAARAQAGAVVEDMLRRGDTWEAVAHVVGLRRGSGAISRYRRLVAV